MKKCIIAIACALTVAALATGCSKQKTCRCAIPGKPIVRVVTIDKGECTQLLVYDYHTPTEANVTDTLYCMDYEFMIDSVYKD